MLLALLLIAGFAFREWCVWRLPRMERVVDAAWKEFAGVALSEVPAKFPSQETNDAALKLEAAVAKLGICLAPAPSDTKTCPRNAPTPEAVKGFEALTVKDAKGEERSLLTDYVNHQMERPDSFVEAPPAALQQFITAHQGDLDEIDSLLQGELPHWGFKTEVHEFELAVNLAAHIALYRLLAATALSALQGGDAGRCESVLRTMAQLENPLSAQPQTVNLLIRVAERRMLLAIQRKESKTDSARLHATPAIDWIARYKQALVYESWKMDSSVAVIARETKEPKEKWLDHLTDSDFWKPASRWHHLHARLSRPYSQLSMLQVSAAVVRDDKLILLADHCHPIMGSSDLPGISFSEPAWYRPGSFLHHPNLSWWNPIGKIIYAIVIPNGNEVKRGFRLDLESELTSKVLHLRAARLADGHWPAALPGIESSICKNEKWSYAVATDGSASLNFSGKPEWGKLKGAQVPLHWTEAADTLPR